MNEPNQSFNVDDIRRVRDEASARYEGMTFEEISHDIHERAEIVHRLMEKRRAEKAKRQGA